MESTGFILIQTTIPDTMNPNPLCRALVDSGFSPCVQIIGTITSTFTWNNQIESSNEQLITIKSKSLHFDAIADIIRQHHPYECPEIIATPITHLSSDYALWLKNNTLGHGELGDI